MSLINDALKKAQRQRHEEQSTATEGSAGERVAKRGRPMSAQLLIVLAAAGVVLIVGSAVLTLFFINREPPAPVRPVVAKFAPAPAADTPSPVIVAPAPIVNPPAATALPAPAKASPSPASAVASTSAATAAPPVAAAPTGPDPHIQAYVDAIRVTGIRSSGSDSKVLMNDRVYRLDDVVETNLGLKLVKVTPDAISFSDANGIVYVKHF